MKRRRFSEEQIVTILKEHELGAKASDLARKHGISDATLTIGRPSMARPPLASDDWLLNLVVCINLSGLFVELDRSWP